MEIGFALETSHATLKEATPKVMNSNQGSHFTSSQYTSIFLNTGARISMDYHGRAYDNIFIKRLWRKVKYENVYPQAYERPCDARMGINGYLNYYNQERRHSSRDYKTPEEIYFGR